MITIRGLRNLLGSLSNYQACLGSGSQLRQSGFRILTQAPIWTWLQCLQNDRKQFKAPYDDKDPVQITNLERKMDPDFHCKIKPDHPVSIELKISPAEKHGIMENATTSIIFTFHHFTACKMLILLQIFQNKILNKMPVLFFLSKEYCVFFFLWQKKTKKKLFLWLY